MKIFGVDFTSAPSHKKTITCLETRLDNGTLSVGVLNQFTDFVQFEAFLHRPGPWVAGFDFPFGQPRKLIQNLRWPNTWAGYVQHIAQMGQHNFEQTITTYRNSRPTGDKHHLRTIDAQAKAISPMMLHGVPVGKMFYQGAPRLLFSGVSIQPCHPIGDNRIALEVYPALVARKWLGQQSYKNDSSKKQTPEQKAARQTLLDALCSPALKKHYGLTLHLSDTLAAQLVQDPTADSLDALLCAIQAAWACTQPNFGIPPNCDPLEGWIIDPGLA